MRSALLTAHLITDGIVLPRANEHKVMREDVVGPWENAPDNLKELFRSNARILAHVAVSGSQVPMDDRSDESEQSG